MRCLEEVKDRAVFSRGRTKVRHTVLHAWFIRDHLQEGIEYSRHIPPENAIKTLKALVLFSVLASDLRPFRIPTMIANTSISPAEHTAKETLEMRFRSIDSYSAWSASLWDGCQYIKLGRHLRTDDFVPSSTSDAESFTSGRSLARPGKAAVQNVSEHCERSI